MTPPDDIRHRELKWDIKTQMWVSRDFKRINKDFTRQKETAVDYFGRDGATKRLGRAAMLRGLTAGKYNRLKGETKSRPIGACLPLIIEACAEDQFSYEYRHGATSHGAFTFSLASILRREKAAKRSVNFDQLVAKIRGQLVDLEYDQTPQILGPTAIRRHKVPLLP